MVRGPLFRRAETTSWGGLGPPKILGTRTFNFAFTRQKSVPCRAKQNGFACQNLGVPCPGWMSCKRAFVGKRIDTPIIVYEDNQGAIELTKNANDHGWTKHIDISHHFVRERVIWKEIMVKYCPTNEVVADIMTKGLAKPSFQKLRKLSGIDVITAKISSGRVKYDNCAERISYNIIIRWHYHWFKDITWRSYVEQVVDETMLCEVYILYCYSFY
mgnify:CR=1 FL=1